MYYLKQITCICCFLLFSSAQAKVQECFLDPEYESSFDYEFDPSIERSYEDLIFYDSAYRLNDPFQSHENFFICEQIPPCSISKSLLLFAPSFQARIGDGRSYENGYGSVGGFLTYFNPDSCNALFVDLDFLRIGEGRFGLNSLFGIRGFTSDYERMIGAYICYDHRHIFGGDINQFGLGAEFLGECWDLRINGYIPFKKKRVFLDALTIDYIGDFFAIRNRYASAMWGLDVELGKCLLTCSCFEIYMGVGPYFYKSNCCGSLVGGMGRLTSSLWNKLFLEFYTSYDCLFQFKAQGQLSLYIPFTSACEWWKCVFQPVYRNRVIVVEEICRWETNF